MHHKFLVLFLILFLAPVRAQQPAPQESQTKKLPPPPQQNPRSDNDDVLRITSNLVQVDAVVVKDGKQVTDLTADDFEIFEDDKPQKITNFSYISNVTSGPGAESNASQIVKTKTDSPVAPAVIRPQDTHRTIAIVVDDLGISLDSIGSIKNQLRKFVAQEIAPNDLVAIIRTGGEVGALQQFTTDRRLLNRAVESLRWNPCSRAGTSALAPARNLGFDQGRLSTQDLGSGQNNVGLCATHGNPLAATIRALRFILQGMRSLPGRKSMIVMSDSLPQDIPNLDSLERGPIKVANPVSDSLTDEVTAIATESDFGNDAALRHTAEIAIRSSVVIYGLDTRGMLTTGPTAADNFSASSTGVRRGTGYIATQQQNVLGVRSTQLQDGRGGLDMLSRQTGGLLVTNTNADGFQRVIQDQQGYYLIGYRPAGETFDRRFHHLKAQVKRPGVTVRTREGYFGLKDQQVLPAPPSNRDRINSALISPFGSVDIDLRLTAVFANTKDAGSFIRSVIYLKAQDLTFSDEPDGSHKANFDLSGIVFGDNGAVVHQIGEARTLHLRKQDYERVLRDGLVYQLDIPIKKPGAYQFRVAVRDSKTSHVGVAGELVEVPDLHNQHLALSGITLSNANASEAMSAKASAAAGLAESSIANPAVRRFHQASSLYFAYVVYKAQFDSASHAPDLSAQVRMFFQGKLVWEGAPKPISFAGQNDPERISAGGGLQIGSLAPGEYILQIVVTDARAPEQFHTATQWIDFEIVK
jgi:VWFA-related protein